MDGTQPTIRENTGGLLLAALAGVVVWVMLAVRPWLMDALPMHEGLNAWLAVSTGLVVQSVPFLVFGVTISALVTAFLPAGLLGRIMPRSPMLAVPVAGVSGVLLPGCECGSVPISDALMRRGLPPAAALTFLLAAPAINPVVIVATAVAFPTQPMMPWARLAASLLAALLVGWWWVAAGRTEWFGGRGRRGHSHDHRGLAAFVGAFVHDFVIAGGYLVVGAMVAAVLNVFGPRNWIETIASNPWYGVLAMALLAVVIAVCSEADAFVAASLTQFSPMAQLVFMVVSPMVDIKLIAMQHGAFGPSFTWRFAPITLVVAVASAVAVGTVML